MNNATKIPESVFKLRAFSGLKIHPSEIQDESDTYSYRKYKCEHHIRNMKKPDAEMINHIREMKEPDKMELILIYIDVLEFITDLYAELCTANNS